MKTNKSFTKRLKITKNKKILARKPGQNHFNAKESASMGIAKRRTSPWKAISNKDKSRFFVNTKATN